jgi:chloramphenicol-sensitive protein RarD
MLDRTASPATASEEAARAATRRGFFYALAAYLLWGVMPLYMKAVAHIPSLEVLSYRILWSVPTAAAVVLALGLGRKAFAALRSPRTVMMAMFTAVIIAFNWGIYVWAVAVGRTVETALGYYINPLVTIAMGALLLGERLTRPQLAAVGLAAVAVIVLTIDAGGLPWVSLSLAITFAVYGYLRKTLPVGAAEGFFLEVLLLAPLALAYVAFLAARGESHGLTGSDFWLLMAAGPVTAAPLILFAFGAKLLPISTIGIMQYIGPTLIGAIGIFVFGEPFGTARIIAFALIWVALIVYTVSMFRERAAGA